MSDLLQRLVERALGRTEVVQPQIGPRFGPEPPLQEEEPETWPRPRGGAAPAREAAGEAAERSAGEPEPD